MITETGQPGQVIDYASPLTPHASPIQADLGAGNQYLVTPATGNLAAGAVDRYGFAVRSSELASTTTGTIYLGVSLQAEAGSTVLPAVPTIQGLTPIVSRSSNGTAFALYAIEREGLHLLEISGATATTAGAYSLRVFVAGDANVDGKVDGVDGNLLTAAFGSSVGQPQYNQHADANRDGHVDATDVQFLSQNLGFAANLPPVVTTDLLRLETKTHQDLDVAFTLTSLVTDPEDDAFYFRVTGADHGTARISGDGQSIIFSPSQGYFGPASFRFVADDGYGLSPEGTINVNVSNAPLVGLDFVARNPKIQTRHTFDLQLIGDFTDQQDVLLPASYLQFTSSNPAAGVVSSTNARFTGLTDGVGYITASTAHGPSGVTIQAVTAFSVGIPTDRTQLILYALGLDVFPGAVSLPTNGGERQILVSLVDQNDLGAGSTGTRYFIENSSVVSVSSDGRITAGQAGEAVVTVINGPAEFLIPVKVEAPHAGPTVLGTQGGIVQGPDGSLVAVAPGSMADGIQVSIAPVTQAAQPLPTPDGFDFGGSFQLEVGADKLSTPVQLAIPVLATVTAGSQVFFMRYATLLDENGAIIPVWLQEESGVVGTDGMARTTSPPFGGVTLSGTYQVAIRKPGLVGMLQGTIDTFFPTVQQNLADAFAVLAPLGGGSASGMMGALTTGLGEFVFALLGGNRPLKIVEIPAQGLPTVTNAQVQINPDTLNNFSTTVINTVSTGNDPWDHPVIESARLDFPSGSPELVFTGKRFTYSDPAAPADKRAGSHIQDLTINFRMSGKSAPVPGQVLSGSDTELRVQVPAGAILGLSDITVVRPQWIKHGTVYDQQVMKPSNAVRINAASAYLMAGDVRTGVSVANAQSNALAARIPIDPLSSTSGPRSVAFTHDNTRAYVTLRGDHGIGVIDAQTLQEVDIDAQTSQIDHIDLGNARPFWAVVDQSDKFLYVSDEVSGLIHIVDIDPASQAYHTKIGSMIVDSSPTGLRGMAINADGTKLYVAAPTENIFSLSRVEAHSHIHVIDLNPDSSTYRTKITSYLVDGGEAYGVAASPDPNVIAFTNRRSDPHGVGVIHADTGQVNYVAMALGPANDYFDLNNASGIVFSPNGQYIFVTGYNKFIQGDPSHDPHLDPNKPAGGNVGVIGNAMSQAPKLLAATTPIPESFPDNLVISGDGKYLYAAFRSSHVIGIYDVALLTSTASDATLASSLQLNPIDQLVPGIDLGIIATGGLPQGLAAQGLSLILTAPLGPKEQDLGNRPTFTWEVNGAPPGVKSALYISTVSAGNGLFPDDFRDAQAPNLKTLSDPNRQEDLNDLNRHRILNGVLVSEQAGQQGKFEYQLPANRALTTGQKYYWGVVAFGPDGSLTRQHGEFTYEAKIDPSATTFSSVTVLTHGFELGFNGLGLDIWTNNIPDAFYELAQAISRAAGGGIVAQYNKVTGGWRIYSDSVDNNQSLQNLTAANATFGRSLILLPDWIVESDISDSGFSEAAADSVFASLAKLNSELGGKVLSSPLHFIGHSRGTVVNSEIIQRLGTYKDALGVTGRIQMTTLDPHDFIQSTNDIQLATYLSHTAGLLGLAPATLFGKALAAVAKRIDVGTISYGDFKDPDVQRWANVSYADNYYQKVALEFQAPLLGFPVTATPNGREIANFDYTFALSGDPDISLPPRAGFAMPFNEDLVGGAHSRVWRWYAGTADLSIDHFEFSATNEPIIRSEADLKNSASSYKHGDTWYRGQGFAVDDLLSPWEGIKTGWAFAPQGGVTTSSTFVGVPVTEDNTEVPHAGQPAVPTVFNGSFEYGNLHPTARWTGHVGSNFDGIPGWEFQGGESAGNILNVVTTLNGNHAIELRTAASLLAPANPFMVHNRLYVPTTATSLDFDFSVQQRNLTQVGRLEITALVAGQTVPTTIGVVSLDTGTSSFQRLPLALPSGLQGQVVTLRFELVGTSPDRVQLDNIAFGPGGQPLQVAAPGTDQTVTGLLPLGLIDVPGWNGGVNAGGLQGATPDLLINDVGTVLMQRLEDDGSTGLGQGGFDSQTLTAHQSWIVSELVGQEQAPFVLGILAYHLGLDGDAAFTPDSHAVQPQFDAVVRHAEMTRLHDGVVQGDVESGVEDDGAFVDDRSVGIANVHVSLDPAAPSSQGALPNLLIHSLDEVTLFLLESLANSVQIVNRPGVQAGVELGITAGLNQSEQSDQQPLPNHAGTLSRDAEAVKQIAQMARRLGMVSFEVADLPGTYVALTRFERDQSGTVVSSRVTIDQDAAGYGWFVDLTPLDNSEFDEQLTDWAGRAGADSPAAGKIDLLTTIYHELGHVMGLDHISSDNRSYDVMTPILQVGVRSLPTSFDLTLFSDDVTYWDGLHVGSGFNGGSPASGGGSGSGGGAAVIPPEFQANNLPPATHTDILNGTFANGNVSDPQFTWDLRGGVSVEHGAAVLREDGNLNNSLSQAFFLPANVQSLHFTVSNLELRTESGVPPDAFEVALLDSATLTPLAGVVDGLTLTDSLLNIQAGGTTYKHAGVTLTPIGTSGTSYLVDVNLTGVTVGTGARLYFDLLGFGDRTSSVTIDNVLLTTGQPTASPVAVNDSYSVAEGTTLTLSAVEGLLTNDSDSDTPTFGLTAFSLTAPTHGTLTLNADGSFTYTHNGTETLTDSFTYRVSDGINFSNLDTVSLTITPTNDAPVIAAIPAQSVEQGRTLTVNVLATDPDDSNLSPESNILTFSLQPHSLSGVSLDPATGLLTWAVPRIQTVGLYTIAVTVTDAGTPALSVSRSFTVDVLELSNTAPTLDPIGPKSVNEESEIRFTLHATDLDVPAQPLTFSASGLPTGATFDVTTHEFAWTPAEDQGGASYQVTFSVTDGEFSASEIVTITVNEVNVAPVLAPIGNKSVNEQAELRFTISATDADLPAQLLTFSASGLPAGATFDVTTHEFIWTPTEAQGPGTYTVTFSVTDGVATTSELVLITVNEVNIAPVLAPIGARSVNEETELRFTISGSDVDAPSQTLVYSATGLPTGALFNATTREFVWTPTEAQGPGSYNITFLITDGVVTTSEAVTITVNEINVAPILAPIGNKSVNEQAELRFTISATDADLPAQLLTFSASGLPAGATFDVTTHEFIWTPTEAQGPGTYHVTFSVTDGVVTTSETIAIAVNEVNLAPVLAPIGNQTVNEGALLSFTASATDADLPVQTLTYSLATGAPAGSVIHATTGVFTWTPTEGPGASPYSVTVQVSDGVVTTSETIGIAVLNVAPTVSLIPATNVQEGVSASTSIQFQDPGSLDTHTIQINWGDGTALDTINSTATAAAGLTIPRSHTYADGGTYTITVTVTDDEGASRSVTANVTVANLAPTVTLTPATQTKQYSDPITPIIITATDVTADTLNVTTAWSINGTTFTAGLPDELSITGGLSLSGAANQVGTAAWTISGVADLDPAKTYQIRVTVTDEDGGSTVQQSVIDLDQEEARVTYDGVLYASTPSINTTTTTIQLRATVQDITAVLPGSDADLGLITKATVTFVNRDTGAVIASNVPITLVNPADPTTGTAVYNWTVTLPNNSDSESYTIGTIVNGFYTRNASADNTVVTVSLPQNDFLTGGGYLVNTSSAGTYAGDVGEKTNFGFNVKFNKQLTNLQGKANIIIRQGGQIYQVKTNATQSLATTEVSPGVYDATFTSKANLTNITNPLAPISLGGNLDLIVILRDAGEPGTSDTIGMTLWQGSTLLYSSNWTGTQTVTQLLGGGNLQVRPSAPLLAQGGALAEDGSIAALTAHQLSPIVEEAKARWMASGLTAEQAAALSSIQFTIADLEGATIGLTNGASVLIDRTAAGHGWFLDVTPTDQAEFHFVRGLAQWIADAHSPAFSRMDLLTTVMHEMGHVLGYDDQQALQPGSGQAQRHSATLMTETLPTGVRRSLLTPALSHAEGSVSSDHAPLTTPHRRSVLDTFAGVWGKTGTDNGSGTAPTPVIDWAEIDEPDARQKKAALGASAQKASWLQRFLLHMGQEEATPHDHGIEVTLLGKKK